MFYLSRSWSHFAKPFSIVVFWVVPSATLCFEDWYVTVVEAAWVFISFFSGGAVDPSLEIGHGG